MQAEGPGQGCAYSMAVPPSPTAAPCPVAAPSSPSLAAWALTGWLQGFGCRSFVEVLVAVHTRTHRLQVLVNGGWPGLQAGPRPERRVVPWLWGVCQALPLQLMSAFLWPGWSRAPTSHSPCQLLGLIPAPRSPALCCPRRPSLAPLALPSLAQVLKRLPKPPCHLNSQARGHSQSTPTSWSTRPWQTECHAGVLAASPQGS